MRETRYEGGVIQWVLEIQIKFEKYSETEIYNQRKCMRRVLYQASVLLIISSFDISSFTNRIKVSRFIKWMMDGAQEAREFFMSTSIQLTKAQFVRNRVKWYIWYIWLCIFPGEIFVPVTPTNDDHEWLHTFIATSSGRPPTQWVLLRRS